MDNTQALKETTDKLKEIREKYITDKGGDISKNRFSLSHDDINTIQSETYQLGITTERKTIYDKIYNYFNGENKTRLTTNSVIVINDILNQLKEKK